MSVRELCNIILLSYTSISADHEQSNENYFISSLYHTIIIYSSPPKTCSNMILTNMTLKIPNNSYFNNLLTLQLNVSVHFFVLLITFFSPKIVPKLLIFTIVDVILHGLRVVTRGADRKSKFLR